MLMCRESLIDFSKYEVHEDGTIFSKTRNRNLKCYTSKRGYNYVCLRCNGGYSDTFQLHRVIYYFFNGEIPEGMQVNHIDEDKSNNVLNNLNLLTPRDNSNYGARNEKISISRIGKTWSEESKNHLREVKTQLHVLQYGLKTNKPIKIWLNAHEIERKLGYNRALIYWCCRGGHFIGDKWQNNTQAYGFGWKFV